MCPVAPGLIVGALGLVNEILLDRTGFARRTRPFQGYILACVRGWFRRKLRRSNRQRVPAQDVIRGFPLTDEFCVLRESPNHKAAIITASVVGLYGDRAACRGAAHRLKCGPRAPFLPVRALAVLYLISAYGVVFASLRARPRKRSLAL